MLVDVKVTFEHGTTTSSGLAPEQFPVSDVPVEELKENSEEPVELELMNSELPPFEPVDDIVTGAISPVEELGLFIGVG